MSRRDRSSRGVRVIVVCPTEYGGQIEHAADGRKRVERIRKDGDRSGPEPDPQFHDEIDTR